MTALPSRRAMFFIDGSAFRDTIQLYWYSMASFAGGNRARMAKRMVKHGINKAPTIKWCFSTAQCLLLQAAFRSTDPADDAPGGHPAEAVRLAATPARPPEPRLTVLPRSA